VNEKLTPNGDMNHVSAKTRFMLAAICCGIFIITVVVFARMTLDAPLVLLRNVTSTFWGVIVNFAICLGTVAYVSRRLHKARTTRANDR
jgi:hypothetical protein